MKVSGILETSLYVDDLDKALKFYGEILGLEFVSREKDRHVFFRCGGSMFLLFNPEMTEMSEEVPDHGARGAGHVAFSVDSSDIPDWIEFLKERGVAIEADVSFSRGRSIYFRDPSGNSVEITTPKIWNMEE